MLNNYQQTITIIEQMHQTTMITNYVCVGWVVKSDIILNFTKMIVKKKVFFVWGGRGERGKRHNPKLRIGICLYFFAFPMRSVHHTHNIKSIK